MIRVVVADDHPIFLDGLRVALRAPDVVVVGAAKTADETVALVSSLAPDVAVVDLQMPGHGLEAIRHIVSLSPSVRVVVLTMSADTQAVNAALRAGARGYVVKGADRDELLGAIRAVARGDLVFGTEVAAPLLSALARAPALPFPELTSREREVLGLVAEGLTNAAIARRLFLSPKTVRNHVSNILAKLGVPDRESAAVLVRDRG